MMRCLEAVQMERQDLRGTRAGHAQAGGSERGQKTHKIYLMSRQSVRAPPLSPMSLPGSSSRGNQAFPPAESPGLLPDTCTLSPARHSFLLQCLRAVGRNRPAWLGAEPLSAACSPSAPQPHMGGCTPLQSHSPGQLLWAPAHPWGVPGSPHPRVQASLSSKA